MHYGFIIIHSKGLRPIRNSYPRGIGLDYSKQLVSNKAWEFCNCYPRVGFSFTFWDFDNPPILGYGLTAMGYLEPVYFAHKKVNFSLRMGMGIGYHSKPYHPETNPNNLSYSTYFGFPLMLNIGLKYRLNPYLNLSIEANYNHISNGGIKEPNKGINYPTANIGLDYTIEPFDFKERGKYRKPPPSKKQRIEFAYISAFSNAGAGNTQQHYIYGVEGKYSRWAGRSSAITVGTEWVVDGSRKVRIMRDSTAAVAGFDHKRGAILIGHEFWAGRVIFSQQLGIYYYDQYKTNDSVYQRYGLIIKITDLIFAGINLKSHRHVADFIDIRVGLSF